MSKELLAPAGNMASLKMAIHNGADAVYLAGKDFGARKYAENFSNKELEYAVYYAHLYGVKIYITVNTIIYENELDNCLEYITFLYNLGVDAIIVQDLGLIKLIRKYLPDMEIHASTQAHTHNIEQIKLLESLGVKRVVLGRELSLETINKLDTKMELEIFIHGALCICYSGECLLSSCLLNRSGNRGECAGLCRVLYNLKSNEKKIISNKYLLSPKELNTTNYIEEIKNSKVTSLKIEGRMKSPEYVGYITHLYRKLLDNPNYNLTDTEIFNLKSLYNRGFTKGYLFNNSDNEFISLNSSNHQGVEIGDIIKVNPKRIKIKLTHDLHQEDAIRLPNNKGMYINYLYNEKGLLINSASRGDTIYIENKVNLKSLGQVKLTINNNLKKEIENYHPKKININCEIKAKLNEPLKIKYFDDLNEVEYVGDIIASSISMPITKERIIKALNKLGNTPFNLKDIKCHIDSNIFIPISTLNEIRRNLITELINKRTKTTNNLTIKRIKESNVRAKTTIKISALARTKEQIETLLKNNIEYIYLTNEQLYNEYKKYSNVYLRLNRVMENYPNYQQENLLIGETGSLKYTKENNVITDYYLNVVNSEYIKLLNTFNVSRITLSPELNIENLKLILNNINNISVEIIGYGSLEYMIMKYKLLTNMNLPKNKDYYLENNSQDKLYVIEDNYTHILGNKKINLINNIKELENIGINVFRLELFNENAQEITEIINQINKILSN